MLFQDIGRIMSILVAQTIVGIIFFLCAYNLLRKRVSRLSITSSSFFLILLCSFIFNMIYFIIRIQVVVHIFYFLTIFCIIFGPIQLLMFELNIVTTKFSFTKQKQLIMTLTYAIVLFIILLIPGMFYIGPLTDWTPQWSITLFIIVFCYTTFGALIPIWYYTYKINSTITNEQLKKKWKFYIFGIFILSITLYGFLFYATFWDQTLRTIWGISSAIIFPIGAIFMYISIARQIQEKTE